MVKDRDEKSGRFTATVSDDEIVNFVRSERGVPTIAVADEFDYERPTAYRRLKSLEDDGRVTRREIGNSLLWEAANDAEPDAPAAPETAPPGAPDRPGAVDGPGVAREILDDLDRPGDGTDYEQRLDAVLQMYDHLRSNPGTRLGKQDFKELLAGEDVGYGGGFASLWSNWVKANENAGRPENALAVLPGVEQRGDDYVYQEDGSA